MIKRNFSPEAQVVPQWVRDPLADSFIEDQLTDGARSVRSKRKTRTAAEAKEIIGRFRRRQFNANRDRTIFETEIGLARRIRADSQLLAQIAPEVAEGVIRGITEDTLGGKVSVPKATRKINKRS